MGKKTRTGVFDTDKRIRLGIWGLGRGMSFFNTCKGLNLDVVAGCDFNEHMRLRFKEACPKARVTDKAEEFLDWDFDAVLLATFCPSHGPDAIQCLKAGKHVLSEVTSFHTLAEGVRLVEAVEKTGKVYSLAENYGYTAPHMFLATHWKKGTFGELMYAEGEYVHEVRSLAYTYLDGVPISPGYALHNWRSWLNFHYYCTHSLGPIMFITGQRPTRVVSLPGRQRLPGYPFEKGLNGIAPSLISMDNGAVVRNLMGGTTNDVHQFRYWGTKAAAEVHGGELFLRLGAGGSAPKMKVQADWGEFTPLAEKTGHGGGDFWTLYFFAREILFGTRSPFDVYTASDCTIPGILAHRSSLENGKPYDVPDFSKASVRDQYRSDDRAQPRPDVVQICFPRSADKSIAGRFSATMADLLGQVRTYRVYADWATLADSVAEPERVVELADRVIESYPRILQAYRNARELADAVPGTAGSRLLEEMLDAGDERIVTRPRFLESVKRQRRALARRAVSAQTP